MTDQPRPPQLPHHRLVAYHVAVELLLAVKAAEIRDPKLRDEALRSAKSAVLNIAEGAGRLTRADKARAFTIARGEGLEAFAALETASGCKARMNNSFFSVLCRNKFQLWLKQYCKIGISVSRLSLSRTCVAE